MNSVKISLFLLVPCLMATEHLFSQTQKREGQPAPKIKSGYTLNSIQTDYNYTTEQLVKDVLIGGDCFEPFNVQVIGSQEGVGHFSSGSSSIGISEGIVFSTGAISNAHGPNDLSGTSSILGSTAQDADLQLLATSDISDVTGIQFDFVPTVGQIQFKYVFASEEYCEYVNSDFNDVFGFFISGPGISGGFSGNAANLALLPGTGNFVSINNVNHLANTAYFRSNHDNCGAAAVAPLDIEFDGFTTVLTATAYVVPCETYSIKMVIADVGDSSFDSAVFIEANSFQTGGTATVSAIVPHNGGNPTAHECCNDARFRFTRNADSSIDQPLTVSFEISGSASTNDYAALPNSITIPAGQSIYDLMVEVFCDQIAEGPETIVLTLDQPCTCQNQWVTMEVYDAILPQVQLPDLLLCEGTDSVLVPETSGGVGQLAFAWNNGSTAANLPVTAVPITYTVTVTDACSNTAADGAVVSVAPNPCNALNHGDVTCHGDADGWVVVFADKGAPPYSFTWEDGGQLPSRIGLSGGLYFVKTVDSLGCMDMDSVTIFEPDPLGWLLSIQDATCFGYEDGFVNVDTSFGGTQPHFFSIDGEFFFFNEHFGQLGSGEYTLHLADDNGCTLSQGFKIREPEQLLLELGDDQVIVLGEELHLLPQTNNPPEQISHLDWSGGLGTTYFDTTFVPLNNLNLVATIFDLNGCFASDNINVRIDKQRKVFIPNAFSPNGDGLNDLLNVFSDKSVAEILSFKVFSRWGELLYENGHFQTNQPGVGWDGTLDGQSLQPGTFVYSCEMLFIDGVKKILAGDVVLLR